MSYDTTASRFLRPTDVARLRRLLLAHLRERHTLPAQLPWHGHGQVAGASQLLEVLAEEAVLAVIDRRPLHASREDLVGEYGFTLRRNDRLHHRTSSL